MNGGKILAYGDFRFSLVSTFLQNGGFRCTTDDWQQNLENRDKQKCKNLQEVEEDILGRGNFENWNENGKITNLFWGVPFSRYGWFFHDDCFKSAPDGWQHLVKGENKNKKSQNIYVSIGLKSDAASKNRKFKNSKSKIEKCWKILASLGELGFPIPSPGFCIVFDFSWSCWPVTDPSWKKGRIKTPKKKTKCAKAPQAEQKFSISKEQGLISFGEAFRGLLRPSGTQQRVKMTL